MSSLIPCSTTDLSLIPRIPFTDNNTDFFRRPCLARKSGKYRFSSQRVFLPLPVSVLSFPQLQRQCSFLRNPIVHKVAATGTDVAVEEPDSPAVDEDSSGTPETQDADDTTTPAPSQTRRSRPSWKSEMPPVKNEELVPGASFTGKVRSIQPFGAFVDFGAFTDGLVHVSRLSDSFVKDVGSFVTVGQEVKVKLLEVNFENSRISLSMRENEDSGKSQQRRDSSTTATTDRPRPSRRSTPRTGQKKEDVKSSKFVKGQELTGAVKNLTRSGAFISLPDGEEGFLPSSEEDDDGFASMMGGGSSLEVGQEVNVRVLRISRAQVTLTMKKEDSNTEVETVHGVIHSATNPFVLAFRQNKDIARFLDEREKVEKTTQQPAEPLTSAESESEVTTDIPDVQEKPTSSDEGVITNSSAADESSEDDENSSEGTIGGNLVDDSKDEASETMAQIIEEAPSEGDEISDSSGELAGQLSSSESTTDTDAAQSPPVDPIAKYAEAAPVAEIEEDKSSQQVADGVTTVADEGSDTPAQEAKDEVKSVENLVPSDEASSDQTNSATEELVENQVKSNEDAQLPDPTSEIQDESKKDEEQIPSPTAETEIDDDEGDQQIPSPTSETENESVNVDPQIPSLTAETKTEGESDLDKASSEQMVDVGNLNGQNGNSTPKETAAKATVSPALVKQLREETGAGMMDCKKALAETGGDIVKAQEFLRKKGLASAEKKASRVTAEGRIGSYIHDGRIGVLVEVNCETDFVSRGGIFKELVDDLAMQVAACPQVQYLVTEDVPEEIVNKEKEIEMQKEDLASKPEQIRSKIVEGRIRKRLEELALLEQPYIRNDKVVVKDLVKQTIATIGENIKVRRFVRFNLGEGLEKKSQDFAAEVAAQTAAKKPVTAPAVEQSPTPEAKEESQKPPAVAVSAALVKQLREETGAGMMDCKKALSETGGDLEKAQEYLRKKGLSTADKKSSRLAAEGRIGTYIHDSRIGVLIEVNCETDFVGRSEKFKELVDDLAMQVVACPQVQFVSIEEIPDGIVKKEKEIEMQREDILSKPENIRERIVEGRISKRLGELALLEQAFIRDDSLLVKDLVKQTVAALGENVKVRRFVRFTLGESDEEAKKEDEA